MVSIKSPIEILEEIKRLKKLLESLARDEKGTGTNTKSILYHRFEAKIDALEWVLTEKS